MNQLEVGRGEAVAAALDDPVEFLQRVDPFEGDGREERERKG